MKLSLTRNLFLTLAVTCGAAASASAASVATLHLNNVSPAGTADIRFNGGNWDHSTYVGAINWTVISGSGAGLADGSSLTTFCIEGTQDVYIGQDATFSNLITGANLDTAPQSYNGSTPAMGAAAAASLEKYWDAYRGLVTDSTTGAAFQLGIWEIVYDNLDDAKDVNGYFGAGNFMAKNNAAALNLATNWLDNLDNATITQTYSLNVLSDPQLQDQLYGTPNEQEHHDRTPTTPLPAAFPAGAALLGAIAGARKIRRKV